MDDQPDQRPSGPALTPPEAIKILLRREVGYGCPVVGCASPYLGYHHFDPPWREEHHHRPEGMIALCPAHHPKADHGSFTREQLREMKTNSFALSAEIRGIFDWRRRNVIARLGGNYYVETPILIEIQGRPVVAQRRDDDGTSLMSLQMLTTGREPRFVMVDHEWLVKGTPSDFEAPPSGKRLHAAHSNGDRLTIDFSEVPSAEALIRRWSDPNNPTLSVPAVVEFPAVVVDVTMNVSGTDLRFDKGETTLAGNVITNMWFIRNGVGVSLN